MLSLKQCQFHSYKSRANFVSISWIVFADFCSNLITTRCESGFSAVWYSLFVIQLGRVHIAGVVMQSSVILFIEGVWKNTFIDVSIIAILMVTHTEEQRLKYRAIIWSESTIIWNSMLSSMYVVYASFNFVNNVETNILKVVKSVTYKISLQSKSNFMHCSWSRSCIRCRQALAWNFKLDSLKHIAVDMFTMLTS